MLNMHFMATCSIKTLSERFYSLYQTDSCSAHYHAAVYKFNMLQFSVTRDKTFEFGGCFVIVETDFGSG